MKKFYLIDNHINYLSGLEAQLRSIDCQVFANHGDSEEIHAFRDILRHQPNIIIMDVVFPSLRGFSLLHRLQADHYTNNIPIVVYTSILNKHLEDESINKGAWQFFIKENFSPERLIDRISKIYNSY